MLTVLKNGDAVDLSRAAVIDAADDVGWQVRITLAFADGLRMKCIPCRSQEEAEAYRDALIKAVIDDKAPAWPASPEETRPSDAEPEWRKTPLFR